MNLKKFTKDFKEFSLEHGWKVVMHKEHELFRSKDKYAIIDAEDDVLLKFYLENEDVVCFKKTIWNLDCKINSASKVITVFNEPEVFDE
ncbi:hypothetical protein LIT25_13620 [Bacillus sp. F19]|nr:hypothetical protein LIT25_13620 [Bacillus sp. F19]